MNKPTVGVRLFIIVEKVYKGKIDHVQGTDMIADLLWEEYGIDVDIEQKERQEEK